MAAFELEEGTWLVAKSDLEKTLRGRKVLEYAENKMKTNSKDGLTKLICCTRRTVALL